jgi:uncharacterized membrane protein
MLNGSLGRGRVFWLSLVPIATAWHGENPSASWPTAIYGVLLFMASIAYLVLERSVVTYNGPESVLSSAVGAEVKGKISSVLYVLAIGFAFVQHWVSDGLYLLVAILWIVPDPRIEKTLEAKGG